MDIVCKRDCANWRPGYVTPDYCVSPRLGIQVDKVRGDFPRVGICHTLRAEDGLCGPEDEYRVPATFWQRIWR